MSPLVTETTNPATAEFGMRTFDVRISEDKVIEIAIAQRVREDCPGEMHTTDELLISNQVVSPADLSCALDYMAEAFPEAMPS